MAKKPSVNRLLLVVDDFPEGREMLSEYLRFHGFEVVEATDGDSAVEMAQKHRPRIVLMDLTMPGVDGWEATRRLKADPRTKEVIIIAVTAHALEGDEAKARAAGCDAYIPKPFDLYTLAKRLHDVVARGPSALSKPEGIGKDAPHPVHRKSPESR